MSCWNCNCTVSHPSTNIEEPYYAANSANIETNPTNPWQPWNVGQAVHHTAIQGGTDLDGSPIYVGRIFYKGDYIPAKVVPSKDRAYISWGGKEYDFQSCEIMLATGYFDWIESNNGLVPPNAIPIGRTQQGESLFAARVIHSGSLCIGKVHPSHGCCYIPFGGKEHSYRNYEVLVGM